MVTRLLKDTGTMKSKHIDCPASLATNYIDAEESEAIDYIHDKKSLSIAGSIMYCKLKKTGSHCHGKHACV